MINNVEKLPEVPREGIDVIDERATVLQESDERRSAFANLLAPPPSTEKSEEMELGDSLIETTNRYYRSGNVSPEDLARATLRHFSPSGLRKTRY